MLDTLGNFVLTALMVVVGPALLAFAIAYGIFNYGRRSPQMEQRAEEASKELYRKGEEQERRGDQPFSR